MKRVLKGSPPQSLLNYIAVKPNDSWEQMRNNGVERGTEAVSECYERTINDQGELCAYCERSITLDDPLHRRIEHFHPKSDKSGEINRNLDWNNMLAVCDGGSQSSKDNQQLYPLPENLHCDAHKDYMMQKGKLPVVCEGHLLNPLSIPAFPNLFALDKGTGCFTADECSCANANIPENTFETTAELVSNTINMLNLNCDRLAELRKQIVVNIDSNKKALREKGYKPSEAPEKLIQRYFRKQWPEFFTTLRCCLGIAADEYLESINFN